MIEMGVESHILQQILDGQKTVEGRLKTGKFITLRKGDVISWREDVWQDDRIVRSIPGRATATVTATNTYASFADMLQAVPVKMVLPDAESIGAALRLYGQFYTAAQEAENGVVAISFTLNKN